jgi:GLPGLI family protein
MACEIIFESTITISTACMKKILFLIIMIASIGTIQAQMKEGKVVYERTIKFQPRQNMNPEMAANLPRTRTDRFELSFAKNQSLWEYLPDLESSDENAGGGGGFRLMRMGGGDDLTYFNFETGKRIDQRELASKTYIVEDSIRKLNWKLTNETKTLLNHSARKATAQRIGTRFVMAMENGEMKRQEVGDTSHIVAWFTTEIPVPAGPEFGGQLPGLILELEMNNGRAVYKAIEISSKVAVNNIKEPKGGKKMTAAEFTKERDKIMEEMRRNMPAGGRRMTRVTNGSNVE